MHRYIHVDGADEACNCHIHGRHDHLPIYFSSRAPPRIDLAQFSGQVGRLFPDDKRWWPSPMCQRGQEISVQGTAGQDKTTRSSARREEAIPSRVEVERSCIICVLLGRKAEPTARQLQACMAFCLNNNRQNSARCAVLWPYSAPYHPTVHCPRAWIYHIPVYMTMYMPY